MAKWRHTWLQQAARPGSWTAAVAGLRSAAGGTAAAAAGGGHRQSPSALHWAPVSGPEECTDGTSAFSPMVWALCSFCCGFYRQVSWAGFAAEHNKEKGHVKPERTIWRKFDPCDWSQSSLEENTVSISSTNIAKAWNWYWIFIAWSAEVEHCSDTRWELQDEETGSGNVTLIVLPPAITGYTWKWLGIGAAGSDYETKNSSWVE